MYRLSWLSRSACLSFQHSQHSSQSQVYFPTACLTSSSVNACWSAWWWTIVCVTGTAVLKWYHCVSMWLMLCFRRNECHGAAAWRSGNALYDWDKAAVRCGNAILVCYWFDASVPTKFFYACKRGHPRYRKKVDGTHAIKSPISVSDTNKHQQYSTGVSLLSLNFPLLCCQKCLPEIPGSRSALI